MLGLHSERQTPHTMSHTQPPDPHHQPQPVPHARLEPQLQSEPREQSATQPQVHPQSEQCVFDLDGGRACLDFANTLGSSASATDHLTNYADLVAFVAQSDLITPQDAD